MFSRIRQASASAALTVVGVPSGITSLPTSLRDVDKRAGGEIARALKTRGFRGDMGEAIEAGPKHVLVGLGKPEQMTLHTLRRTGAGLVKALDRWNVRSVRLVIDLSIDPGVGGPAAVAQAVAEGMSLANFRVDFFDGSATTRSKPRPELVIDGHDKATRGGIQRGLTLADCTNYARRLGATPPNICTPAFVAAEAKKMAREVGLTARIIGFAEAKRLNMGGLVSVGQGSDAKPCLIQLEHKPARAARGTKLVLIGKTITYDTGGYSLKVNNGMKGMKYDKNGGMAVLGAMRAIAMLKLPVHVVAFLPAAENMVNGEAYRPDDIITMHNGVTVEVTNTDAEGRLVLADALSYACRTVKPTAIVDLATLTGGVVVALGSWCAGLFCTDADLQGRIEEAATVTGERVWALPLWQEHRDFMRAKHADLWNSGPKRDGHPIQGAAFLSYFVDKDIPWAHLDIAGVNNVEGDTDLFITGPTGYGVRLVTEFVARYARS